MSGDHEDGFHSQCALKRSKSAESKEINSHLRIVAGYWSGNQGGEAVSTPPPPFCVRDRGIKGLSLNKSPPLQAQKCCRGFCLSHYLSQPFFTRATNPWLNGWCPPRVIKFKCQGSSHALETSVCWGDSFPLTLRWGCQKGLRPQLAFLLQVPKPSLCSSRRMLSRKTLSFMNCFTATPSITLLKDFSLKGPTYQSLLLYEPQDSREASKLQEDALIL